MVAGDLAVSDKGPARPTGGAGIVAVLIGPDAPIVLQPGQRGSYMQHVYDFYKPNVTGEYPVMDGHFSNKCYVRAVEACDKAYSKRRANSIATADAKADTNEHPKTVMNGYSAPVVNDNPTPLTNGHTLKGLHAVPNGGSQDDLNTPEKALKTSALDGFDDMYFHSPNCKLLAKSFARLHYNDYIADPSKAVCEAISSDLRDIPYEDSLGNRTIGKSFRIVSATDFAHRVQPSLLTSKMCGNMYTASLYASRVSLICNVPLDKLRG
jgi:hydroxymethylglutaryl-CoA synthase